MHGSVGEGLMSGVPNFTPSTLPHRDWEFDVEGSG